MRKRLPFASPKSKTSFKMFLNLTQNTLVRQFPHCREFRWSTHSIPINRGKFRYLPNCIFKIIQKSRHPIPSGTATRRLPDSHIGGSSKKADKRPVWTWTRLNWLIEMCVCNGAPPATCTSLKSHCGFGSKGKVQFGFLLFLPCWLLTMPTHAAFFPRN